MVCLSFRTDIYSHITCATDPDNVKGNYMAIQICMWLESTGISFWRVSGSWLGLYILPYFFWVFEKLQFIIELKGHWHGIYFSIYSLKWPSSVCHQFLKSIWWIYNIVIFSEPWWFSTFLLRNYFFQAFVTTKEIL